MTENNGDPNVHVREYVIEYVAKPYSPYFAVLVSGGWGTGKTYFVKSLRQALSASDDQHAYVYVSLYGLQTLEELDRQLAISIHPVLDSRFLKYSGRAISFVLENLQFKPPEIDLTKLAEKLDAALYIFDDIERCSLPIETILGHINRLVEHEGRKVIVLCNTKKIADIEKFEGTREKIIGMHFELQPNTPSALQTFLHGIADGDARQLMQAQSESILSLFAEFDDGNLRVLQQSLWDLERVLKCVPKGYQANDRFIGELTTTFLANAFEFKVGRLTSDDFVNRSLNWEISELSDNQENAWTRFRKRYPNVENRERVISNAVLRDVITKGIVREPDLVECFNRAPHFAAQQDNPSWVKLYHWDQWQDSDYQEIIADVRSQLESFRYVEPGEILHVFCTLAWLAREGVIEESPSEMHEQARNYISEVKSRGLKGLLKASSYFGSRSYGSLGFAGGETSEFVELRELLKNAQLEVGALGLPSAAQALLALLEKDPRGFLAELLWDSEKPPQFLETPVLAHCDVDQFVATLAQLRPALQRDVMNGLSRRYRNGYAGLQDEIAWAKKLHGHLHQGLKSQGRLSNARFRIYANWLLSDD